MDQRRCAADPQTTHWTLKPFGTAHSLLFVPEAAWQGVKICQNDPPVGYWGHEAEGFETPFRSFSREFYRDALLHVEVIEMGPNVVHLGCKLGKHATIRVDLHDFT